MNRFLLTEHDIQAGFFQEVGYTYRDREDFDPALFYAVLNGAWIAGGGKAKNALIGKYMAEGWKSGIADMTYDQPRGRYNKLVFEFKREDKRGKKDGGLSPEQITYLQAIKPYAFVRVCYTTDEALEFFRLYMSLPLCFGVREEWTVGEILDGVDV